MATGKEELRMLSVRIPVTLFEEVEKRAEKDGRSLSGYIRVILSAAHDRLDEIEAKANRVEELERRIALLENGNG